MGYLQSRLQQDHLYNKIDWAKFSCRATWLSWTPTLYSDEIVYYR